jgi:hypothetical protein
MSDYVNILAVGISCVALIVASMSLLISYLTYRRGIRAAQPFASAALSPIKGEDYWYYVHVTLESRSANGYSAEYVQLVKPRRAVGLSLEQAYHRENNTGSTKLKAPLPRQDAIRCLSIYLNVKKSGTPPQRILERITVHSGDRATSDFLLFAKPRRWSKTITMDLMLVSDEPVQRRKKVRIVRRLEQLSTPPAVETVRMDV